MATGKILCTLDTDIDRPEAAFTPTGKQIALLESGKSNTDLLLFSLTTGKLTKRVSLNFQRRFSLPDVFAGLAFAADDSTVAAVEEDGVIWVIDLVSATERSFIMGEKSRRWGIFFDNSSFASNGRHVVIHQGELFAETFELWDPETKGKTSRWQERRK